MSVIKDGQLHIGAKENVVTIEINETGSTLNFLGSSCEAGVDPGWIGQTFSIEKGVHQFDLVAFILEHKGMKSPQSAVILVDWAAPCPVRIKEVFIQRRGRLIAFDNYGLVAGVDGVKYRTVEAQKYQNIFKHETKFVPASTLLQFAIGQISKADLISAATASVELKDLTAEQLQAIVAETRVKLMQLSAEKSVLEEEQRRLKVEISGLEIAVNDLIARHNDLVQKVLALRSFAGSVVASESTPVFQRAAKFKELAQEGTKVLYNCAVDPSPIE